jgi:adenine-specific DNA-methyltransferase
MHVAKGNGKQVGDYRHTEATRLNNPTAALAREDIEQVPKRTYSFDPHLSPELVWAGKAEEPEFEVEAPSIHVHERLSTDAILKAARQENAQASLFADPELDRAKQVEFYEHEMGWANRLILGDSLVAMTSLLERERLAGQVQLVYIDPPYGINYNSNFQARISDRTPKEASDKAITREPEQIQAYRDTWQLGIHSYLTYLRQRLVAARELLADSGSVVVQIGPENVHRARALMDEIFGEGNFVAQVTLVTTSGTSSPSGRTSVLSDTSDYLLWFARDLSQIKYRQIYVDATEQKRRDPNYAYVELSDGSRRRLIGEEKRHPEILPAGSKVFRLDNATAQKPTTVFPFELDGKTYLPGKRGWRTTREGMDRIGRLNRWFGSGETLSYVLYADDSPGAPISNVWTDLRRSGFGAKKRYVVETLDKVVHRVIAMTTDPGDLVLDPTCGSGTTAYVAERLGRRWITIDTSRIALSLARERLLTASFPYYRLADDARGVDGGLRYGSFERITLRSLAYGEDPESIPLYESPQIVPGRTRVSGPFTVESLSRYADNPFDVDALEEVDAESAGDHVTALLDALSKHGIPRKGFAPATVKSLDPLPGSGALHAEGLFIGDDGKDQHFAVSIGPRHGPVTVGQIDEAMSDSPGYQLIVFAGFTATAEAQEYLAPGKRGRVKVALLEANADLLLGDLLKNTTASQTFRLFAAPDAVAREAKDGSVFIELSGMDSFDAATGEVVSRNRDEIAAWFLDHDYDGSVFHVNQAFFTRNDAWEQLGKALKETIDREVIDSLHSFVSLPFSPGPSGKAAIRVVDDAGQTSEAIIDLATAS